MFWVASFIIGYLCLAAFHCASLNWFSGLVTFAYTEYSNNLKNYSSNVISVWELYFKWWISTQPVSSSDGFNYQMMSKSPAWLIQLIKNIFSCFMLIHLVCKMKEKKVAWHQLPSVLLHHQWRPLGFPPERWRHSRRDYLWSAASLEDTGRDREMRWDRWAQNWNRYALLRHPVHRPRISGFLLDNIW